MKKKAEEPKEGALTRGMDYGTPGFDEFQAVILQKSRSRSEVQKQKVELLALKFQMEDYNASDGIPEKTAGDFLKDFLRILDVQQKYFAKYIGMKPSNLSKVIKGERPVNNDLALIFARLFNHDPILWIEIQAKNEMNRIRSAGKEYETYSLGELLGEQEAAYLLHKKK